LSRQAEFRFHAKVKLRDDLLRKSPQEKRPPVLGDDLRAEFPPIISIFGHDIVR
jgi:hypothetical protein